MSINSSLGVANESTYGTGVTVTRFYPMLTEKIGETVTKLESEGRRAGARVLSNTLSIPIFQGATGDVELPIMSKDMGFWLKHMLGAVATSGPTDSMYTHTGTIASLKGTSFSAQINRPFHDSGTDQPFTYTGGKVASWSIEAGPGMEPKLQMTWDFYNMTTSTALATPSYTTGLELLSWAHANATLTIAGTQVPVTKFSLKCDNGLKLDRYYIRGSGLKKEPVASAYRDIEWEVEADFSDLTQYNRFNQALGANQYAQIVCTLAAPTLGGATTYPSTTITIPAARFDKADIDNSSTDPSMVTLGGKVRDDGTNSPVTIAVVTSQATP